MVVLETATEEEIAAELCRRIDAIGGEYLKLDNGDELEFHGTVEDNWRRITRESFYAEGPCVVLKLKIDRRTV